MMLRDDCALNLWRIQIAPKPQACSRYTDFPKSLGHARGHCGAHFERLVDANKIIIQEVQLCLLKTSSAAEILVRYRPKCGPETRSKFEFSIRTRKFPDHACRWEPRSLSFDTNSTCCGANPRSDCSRWRAATGSLATPTERIFRR
jgi:hypothetical protein